MRTHSLSRSCTNQPNLSDKLKLSRFMKVQAGQRQARRAQPAQRACPQWPPLGPPRFSSTCKVQPLKS